MDATFYTAFRDIAHSEQFDTILDTALEMADAGKPVFPVGHNKRPPYSNADVGAKRGEGGLKLATTDPEKVEWLFTDNRWARRITGIGMPTGKASGCTVIDADCGRGKANAAKAAVWVDNNRDKLRGTSVVRTQSGGLHYYCAYTEGIPSAGDVWAAGIDCRNDGGYVVVPPFMGYQWQRQLDEDDWLPPPEPPPRQAGAGVERDPDWWAKADVPAHVQVWIDQMRKSSHIKGSGWHSAMIRLVAHMVSEGWSDAEILRHSFQWTRHGYKPEETFNQVYTALQGARAKFEAPKKAELIANRSLTLVRRHVPLLTNDEQRELYEALKEVFNEE